ncbi:MAG TPA: hypothetical protein VE863_10760 [Pyrinomonadaceae bacterium]|jgi:hypothetical protein|nr:hypothetical protein [Pyrinomonadaceae bacterium]
MDKLITALAPVFAAGLGIQQFGEILTPIVDKISVDNKKIILGLVSLTLGLVLAFTANLHVLNLLGVTSAPGSALYTVDAIVTGLIISGGTEGINSVLKFLKYTKEDKKNEAAAKGPANANAAAGATTTAALDEINKK